MYQGNSFALYFIVALIGKTLMTQGRFSGGSVVKNPPTNAQDTGWIPRSGRSPGEGNGNPLQYSYLGNPKERGAWQATIHGITKEWDTTHRLNNNSDTTCWTSFHVLVYNLFIFLGEQSLMPIFNLDCLFSYCWILKVLCLFWLQVLYKIGGLWNYFHLFLSFPFT